MVQEFEKIQKEVTNVVKRDKSIRTFFENLSEKDIAEAKQYLVGKSLYINSDKNHLPKAGETAEEYAYTTTKLEGKIVNIFAREETNERVGVTFQTAEHPDYYRTCFLTYKEMFLLCFYGIVKVALLKRYNGYLMVR